jgi:hypothetical protein
MNRCWRRIAIVLALLASAAGAVRPAGASSARPAALAGRDALAAAAETLYVTGEFAAADSLYALILSAAPKDTLALRGRGGVALLENRLPDARRWYEALLAQVPDHRGARRGLAECWVRSDDYARAAALLRLAGREPRARQLESFAGRKPYRADARTAEVAFVQTDPLPVLQVSVNGSGPVFFIIDTGAADLVLDDAFADSVRARTFGADSGTFAGGRRASFVYGAVDSVALGGITVRDVPVQIMSTRRFAGAAGGRRVDGIVGTVFLYHFLATLDYPAGRLVLRPRGEAERREVERAAAAESATVIPYWMVGDHYMVARGRINSSPPLLWFIDTGLAGAGFTCPEATVKAAGIDLSKVPSFDGMGGGGSVKVTPFGVDSLMLGPVLQRRVYAFYGPFPPTLERGLGFRISGLLSHGFLRHYRLTMDFDRMRYFLR